MDPVARRYAQALAEQAAATGALDTVDGDLDALAQTLDGSRELRAMLASPVVSRGKKTAVLQALFGGTLSTLTNAFLDLLVRNEREAVIPGVAVAYQTLRDEARGIVTADVRTAKPLDPAEADRLKAALEARSGKTVRMTLSVQPELVGGLVVRLGDTVYDRSVRHQLSELKDQLVASAHARTN